MSLRLVGPGSVVYIQPTVLSKMSIFSAGRAGRASRNKWDFDSMLLEAVDEGLLALGKELRHAIYRYLEVHKGLKREELPDRLEEFSEALEGIFGYCSQFLEKAILKRLYKELGLEFKQGGGSSFKDYVDNARRAFERAMKNFESDTVTPHTTRKDEMV